MRPSPQTLLCLSFNLNELPRNTRARTWRCEKRCLSAIVAAAAILLMVGGSGCSRQQSNEDVWKALTGQWEQIGGAGDVLTFEQDGTFLAGRKKSTNTLMGTYVIFGGNRIQMNHQIDGTNAAPVFCQIEVSDKEMLLVRGGGVKTTYRRAR